MSHTIFCVIFPVDCILFSESTSVKPRIGYSLLSLCSYILYVRGFCMQSCFFVHNVTDTVAYAVDTSSAFCTGFPLFTS